MDEHHSVIQWVGNSLSLGAIFASVIGWLPAIGAIVAIIWYTIQIIESDTLRKLLDRRRQAKLVRLKAQLADLEKKLTSTPPLILPPGA